MEAPALVGTYVICCSSRTRLEPIRVPSKKEAQIMLLVLGVILFILEAVGS